MTEGLPEAVHATALVLGEAGVLIRGPSGAGKSRLALLLLDAAARAGRHARLVGDDRVLLSYRGDRILAAPHPAIAGLIEHRTHGLIRMTHAPRCVLRLLVELSPPDAPLPRFPEPGTSAPGSGLEALPRLRLQGPPDGLSWFVVAAALRDAS